MAFSFRAAFSLIHLDSVSQTFLPLSPMAPLPAPTWRSHLVLWLDSLLWETAKNLDVNAGDNLPDLGLNPGGLRAYEDENGGSSTVRQSK